MQLWRGRVGESFHAKGLWLFARASPSARDAREPVATVVGSSNYGRRSHERDLELQLHLVSGAAPLRRRWGDECRRLLAPAREEREPSSRLGRWAVWLGASYM